MNISNYLHYKETLLHKMYVMSLCPLASPKTNFWSKTLGQIMLFSGSNSIYFSIINLVKMGYYLGHVNTEN